MDVTAGVEAIVLYLWMQFTILGNYAQFTIYFLQT